MIASDHTYIEEGTIFRHTFTHSENPSDQQDLLSYNGPCILKVAFADLMIQKLHVCFDWIII